MPIYSASFDNVSVTAAQDFFEITAGSAGIKIHSVHISQSSDAGDSEAELLRCLMIWGDGQTTGSGGSSVTNVPLDGNNGFAGSAVESNNTTVATGGTAKTMHAEAFNVAAGLHYLPPPEDRPIIPANDLFRVNLPAAPADSLTMSGTIVWEE